MFISLYDVALDGETGELSAHELAIFVAPRYLITVRKTPGYSIDPIVASAGTTTRTSRTSASASCCGDCSTSSSTATSRPSRQLDEKIDGLEDLLFDESDTGNQVQRLSYELRKSLVRIRRVVLPTREVLNALMRRESDLVDAALMPYYQDVYDHVLRATD